VGVDRPYKHLPLLAVWTVVPVRPDYFLMDLGAVSNEGSKHGRSRKTHITRVLRSLATSDLCIVGGIGGN